GGSWDRSTYTGVTGLINSGRNGGTWDGSGIVTSSATRGGNVTTLAVAKAGAAKSIADTDTIVWGGETVHGSDTLGMYSWGGDANLDGNLTIDDYGRIDFNFPVHSTGWSNGDFNYDGQITIDDYGILDFNYP